MRVRDARSDDWPQVAALLAELGRPDVMGTEEAEPAREVFVRYLARDDTRAFVAEIEGRIVGFVDMDLRTRLNFTTPQAWIPDLIVAEGDRGHGVGAALLARAEEIARAEGCWSMSLESANWRERAHAFYAREGWTDAAHAFTKNLGDREWPPPPPPPAGTADAPRSPG